MYTTCALHTALTSLMPIFLTIYLSALVGFGRACAPARFAHPPFWAHKAGRCAPPPLAHGSFAAPVFITFSVYYEELSSFYHLVKQTKKNFSFHKVPLDHRGAKGSIVYYIEYHSLCAVVWFGSPHCLSRGKCPPPLCLSIPCMYSSPTLTCVGGGGLLQYIPPNHTTAQKLWYYTQYTHFTTNIMSPHPPLPRPSQLRWSLYTANYI